MRALIREHDDGLHAMLGNTACPLCGTCPFCAIVEHRTPAEVLAETAGTVTIVPLNPVTDGHVLIIPKRHVRDAAESAAVTALAFGRAALWIRDVGPCNLITSVGPEATQSVFHLHLHVIPRRADDGLRLPWSP